MENEEQKSTNNITRDEVERKIAEAKLSVAETQIHFLLTLIAILGTVIPIGSAIWQTVNIGNEMDRMESRFQELANKQLRKPVIECRTERGLLEEQGVVLSKPNEMINIQIYNKGDGTAAPVEIYIYLKDTPHPIAQMSIEEPSDETNYSIKLHAFSQKHILPKDTCNLFIHTTPLHSLKKSKYETMLKIFYGEPNPIKLPFTIYIEQDKDT